MAQAAQNNAPVGHVAPASRFSPRIQNLKELETLTSFQAWKGILLYNLGQDVNFAPFLENGIHWEKK